jgi:hypothetical protein
MGIQHCERILEKAVELTILKFIQKMTRISFDFSCDATQIYLKIRISESSDWIYMEQNRTPSQAFVNTPMNLRCSIKIGEFHDRLSDSHVLKNGSAQWSYLVSYVRLKFTKEGR